MLDHRLSLFTITWRFPCGSTSLEALWGVEDNNQHNWQSPFGYMLPMCTLPLHEVPRTSLPSVSRKYIHVDALVAIELVGYVLMIDPDRTIRADFGVKSNCVVFGLLLS